MDFQTELVPFPRAIVEAVDKIADKAMKHSSGHSVTTAADWEIVEDIFKLWAKFYPDEYQDFLRQQRQLRSGAFNKHGASPDKNTALQHLAELPGKAWRMVEEFFPEQELTKGFIKKLVRRLPILQVPEKI